MREEAGIREVGLREAGVRETGVLNYVTDCHEKLICDIL